MAEIKKYLDQAALSTLVTKIKSEDAKALQAAQDYADGLASNYDEAGAAATAESNAKGYTDQLANGAVADNTAAIAKLNGNATTEGSVAKAIADAKEVIDGDIDAVEAKVDKNAEDIAAINDGTNGILAQAKGYADGKAGEVQSNLDDLAEYVGTIPEGATATDVVGYVIEKTSGIATEGAMTELGNRVGTVEGKVAAIEGDYLKAADKTELEGKIAGVQTAVDTEKGRAEGIEAGLRTDVDAIAADYLKAADKTELQNNIDTVSGAVERLTNGVSAEEIDGVNDLIQYVKDHGTEVTGMQEDIADNAAAIDGVADRVETLEGEMDEVQGAVATKVEQSVYNEKIAALEGADAGQVERIAALEAKFGGADGSVEDMIADAKTEAIEAAATAASNKDAVVLSEAQKYADAEDAKIEARVDALEADTHTHGNKALLDTYTQTEANLADAVAKKHEHSNLSVLEGITSAKITAWDAAEQNAKDYADGLNTTMTGKVDGIDARVTKNAEDIATKAASADLTNAVARIEKNETDIANLTSEVGSFTAITSAEVEALFA